MNIMKLIFGSEYKPQPSSFWKKFWGNKLKEILSVFKVIGIIVWVIAIFWVPSFIKLHPELGKNMFISREEISTNYDWKRKSVSVMGPWYRSTYVIGRNEENTRFQEELIKASDRASDDNYRGTYLYHDPCGNWFTTNELIRIAIIRSYAGNLFGQRKIELVELNNDEFNLANIEKLGEELEFKWTEIEISLPYCASTNVITNKVPLAKLKDVSASNWFECIMYVIFIEGASVGIVAMVIAWLRSNYEKLVKKDE